MSELTYDEPLALIIISAISIGVAAIFASWIALDILLRQGWKSMMLVMIPVYIINALYLWPITLWTYLKYGRPSKPSAREQVKCHDKDVDIDPFSNGQDHVHHARGDGHDSRGEDADGSHPAHGNDCEIQAHDKGDHSQQSPADHQKHSHHTHHGSSDRPMFATVTIGVCHCGAGCVLGDLVGEWIVYGAELAIGNPPRALWVEFLLDFGFAFAFGILFQYFSIAPMANEYGPKVLIRALKADALSLLFFEIGLFGWMAAFQIGIFQWRLPMNTVTYWWMMQIGMFIGHWTGVPINWWLIKNGIKEPCA
ncbi:uncharacterized protein PV09_05462 [Verruconis gallopava]|uniref:DUF4396 domain-containing protein n=1 Tax=Verruconis gallopava TaxID=253628 RepID=A0A0D1XLE1_9PEZI|nr:uncharacterized protein PV09_05462 [Verruconis gallopava]KIW03241.1 hypothetical protein PV09_05462 [Verruconis gallopava]